MNWYCDKCKKIHRDNELCPRINMQLKSNRGILTEIADFTVLAGQEALITSQTLDVIVQGVNCVAGTNLSYEGTQQFARDIQVFKRLNTEAFSRSGVFSTPERAKSYYENVKKIAESKPRAMTSFESKLTGYSQEVDWIRMKQGQLSTLWEKSALLNKNAPGVDGITVNRWTGKTVSRTTIKASKNKINTNSTVIKNVEEAIEKGTATVQDIVFGTKGTGEAIKKRGLKNRVIERNSQQQVNNSNYRLEQKMLSGQATTSVSAQQMGEQIVQGSVVAAAVAVTVSGITSYVRYKNGELTIEEAFSEVSEDTLKGMITGAAISSVSVFIPGGPIGFIAGMAVGIYVDQVCTNVLDEIYGKGAYGAILNSSGYVYGMTLNLLECVEKIEQNERQTDECIEKAHNTQRQVEKNFDLFDQLMEE